MQGVSCRYILQKHYQHFGMVSVASDFDANWIEEDESKGSSYGSGNCS